MKHLKSILFLLLVLLVTLPLLIACGDEIIDNPDDTTQASDSGTGSDDDSGSGEVTRAPVITGEPMTDKTSFSLQSKDMTMTLGIKDGAVSITSFATAQSGKSLVSSTSVFPLPAQYQTGDGSLGDFAWTYQCYFNFEAQDKTNDEYGFIFRFADESTKTTYDLYFTAHFDFDGPLEVYGYLKNEGEDAITVSPGVYVSLSAQGETAPVSFYVHKESGIAQGYGSTFPGSGIYQVEMTAGAQAKVDYSTYQDHNQSGYIPMLYLNYADKCGLYVAHEWTNGIISAASQNGTGDAQVDVALASNDFVTAVPSGESLYLPRVYLGVYDGTIDNGGNVFKKWFLYNKAPDILLDDPNEPLTQQDMQIGLEGANYGIQSIKWDYGWWDSEPFFPGVPWYKNEGYLSEPSAAYLGVFSSYGVKTIREFTDLAKTRGLTLATYILLKDTQLDMEGVPTSVGEYGHPEWFSNRVVTRGQSADLGNVDCVKFYQTYMANFFIEKGVTTWRSDFEPICCISDKANRHFANGTDVQYWCTVGFEELVDYLYANVDGFRYESCSSGGAMKDFFTATKAVVINCDDSGNYHSLRTTFYDSSYCIHPAQLQLPTGTQLYLDSPAEGGTGAGVFGFRSHLVGAVMFSNAKGTQPADLELWEKYLATYNNRIKPLIKYGDLYHILPRPDGVNWDGIAYIDKDAESYDKGIIMIFKPTDQEGDTKTVKIEGLDPDVTYSVMFTDHRDQSRKMTGKQLLEEGLTMTFTEDIASDWIFIRSYD